MAWLIEGPEITVGSVLLGVVPLVSFLVLLVSFLGGGGGGGGGGVGGGVGGVFLMQVSPLGE